MPRFQPGQSGNPSGRPKSAAGLRELLLDQYGDNAEVLVQRLEKVSTGRNPRLALEATRLLLSYHAGTPQQSFELTGRFEHQAFEVLRPDALSRLSAAQLDALAELNGLDFFEDPGRP